MSANPHLTLGGSSWSGNPPLATLRQLTSSTSALYNYTTTTSNVLQGEIDAIVAGGTTALWANYEAISSVNLATNNIVNGGTVTAASFSGPLTGAVTGNVSGNLTGNVTGNTAGTHTGAVVGNVTGNVVGNLSNASLTLNSSNSMNLTNNRGADVGGNSVVDINANFGAATRVNINANAASSVSPVPTSQINLTAAGNSVPVTFNPIGGKITLTANAGSGSGSGILGYGEIDLTANSSGLFAGVIKLSAGANMIYGGPATPYFGLYGQNTMYGATANSLIAGTPPTLPTLVGTNYFYGALGIGGAGNQIVGNRFQGGVGIDFLQPYPNGDLIIQSNANGTDTVVISGVKSLAMSNGGNITGVGNINLTTINSAAYPPPTLTDPRFNSVSTNQISTGASYISSINGLPISAFTNVGDATFNSVSTNQISTGASYISSINGLPISAFTNVGDATFNSVSTNRISTARVWMSSINDSIYFGNQPIGNDIAGINDLQVATGTFNTSLIVNGNFTGGGNSLLGATRVTGLFRVTGGTGANVATIDTAGAITGTSLAVSGAATVSGAASAGSLAVTNSATIGNGLTVTGGTTLIGTTTAGLVQGTTTTFTNANATNANVTNANLVNTNTGIINAGAGSLALTYGSISFNGSPYAPTAGTSSDPTFNSISTNRISTADVWLSSINGVEFVPGGGTLPLGLLSTYVSSFTNFQVSSLQISSATVTGGLFFSTSGANYDITNIFTSTTTNYDAVSSVTNDILNYQMNLTSLPVSFDMGGFLDITAANRALWLNKTIIYSGAFTPGQNPTLNLVGAVTSGDYFDVRNTSATAVLSVWNPYESGGFVMNILPGEFYRFTYTTSWAAAANPTPTTQTSLNTFSLVQGWNNTILSTNNSLTLVAGVTNILGFAQLGNANVTDLTAQQVTTSTSQTQVARVSSLNVSTMNLISGFANRLNISSANISTATVPLIFNSNFSGCLITASSVTTSSITGCLFNSLVSTVATKAGIPGATQQLLNASVAIFSPIPILNLTNLFTAGDTNYSFWNNNGFVAGSQALWFARIETLVVNTSGQMDFYIGDTAVNVQIVYPGGLTNIGNIASGLPQKARFTFGSGTWTFTNVFSDTNLDNNNSLTINQNISQTSIQTTDSLFISTSLLQIHGDTYLNNLIGQFFNVSTLSSLNTYTGQINANNTTTGAISTNTISTNSISTNSIATNTLTTNSLITTAPLTVPSLSTTNISSSVVRAANFIASTRVVTPSISTLVSLNSYNTRLLNNPGNVLVYTEVFVGRNGSTGANIDTDIFVPGVYTCIAVCRNNQFRTLEATLYYNSRASVFCRNSAGFDNYNGQNWSASPGFVSFMSQTDGPGDTFDISIYMISGQSFVAGEDPPFPHPSTFFVSTATVNTGTPAPVTIGVSSFTGSTMTIQALENIAILANYPSPPFVSTGNITIAGTNVLGLVGDSVVVAGSTEVVINCDLGDIDIVATSTINLVGGSNVSVQDMTFTTNNPFNWTGGTIHTLYGDVINGGKYLQWSYNNNPGTKIADNNSITVDAPNINLDGAVSMCNNSINNIFQLNFSNSANIDGTYANQLNFNASNSYFLGNLRFYGSGRTLDIADNDITNVKSIDFLAGNITTGSTFLDINGGGLGTDTSLKSGTSYYTIDTALNVTVNALSTNQVTISQTAGSDFVLFNNGDTRMNAKRDAYVSGDRDTYLLAVQNMNVRAPYTQYITIQQTGAANDSFIQFQPSGVIDQFSRGDMSIRCLSTNNITLSHTGAGSQSYFQLSPPGNVVLNARTYFESIAPSGNYFTSPFTELRGYLTFNTGNNYINNLRHIYGDIGGGGGGLAIDYMYGLFFNGTGRNANLYIDSGNLNMFNYNSGINIASYNSNGTGNFSLYSASNDMFLGTGIGRDINLNSGRYVSVNAAQPGGTFGIYTSTMNTTTLGDTNFNCGLNFSITGGGASQYVTFLNAGTYIQFAGPNIYVATASGGFNLNIPVAIGSAYSLNMQGAPISNVVGIVGHPSSNLEIAANGARNLLFSGSNIQATAYGTIDLTSYGTTNINTAFSNAIVINSDGNLTLQAARTGCNISIYSPDVFITGTSNVIIATSYSTWTGSNNFNILGSNIGITSSNAFDIVASGSGVLMDGTFQRKLSGVNIKQPIFQYDTVATSGSSGSIAVSFIAYPISYVGFACMEDADPAEVSVVRDNVSSMTIHWQGAGGGSHVIAWQTMGT
jgi:hypothetical protein